MWNLVCRPLSYHPVLRHLCNTRFTGLTCYEKKSPPCENFGSLRHAAACFKTPMCSSKKKVLRHAAARCGMLRHAAAALAWLWADLRAHCRDTAALRKELVEVQSL